MGRLTNGSTVRGWLASLALVGSVAIALFATATPASAELVGQLSWSAPFNIEPPPASGPTPYHALRDVSCPSESLCVAVDGQGNVITSTEPANTGAAWTVTHIDNQRFEQQCSATPCSVPAPVPATLEGIDCPTTSLCVAWDDLGYIFTSTNPTAGAGAWGSFKVAPRYGFFAMSCPTTSLCVGMGQEKVFTSTAPTGGPNAWTSASIDVGPCPAQARKGCHSFQRNIDTISCPSASFCAAGDWDGNVLTTTEPTVSSSWRVTYVDNNIFSGQLDSTGQTGIGGISCPDSSHCVATDESGNVLTSEDPAGDSSAWKLASVESSFAVGTVKLACPTVRRCVAAFSKEPEGHYGGEHSLAVSYAPFNGGAWNPVTIGPITPEPGLTPISIISCPTEQLCISVNNTGGASVGRAELLGAGRLTVLLRGASHSLSRPTTRQLRRVGSYTESFTPPFEGSLRIRWMAPAAGKPHSKPHSLASGAYVFHSVAAQNVELRVTQFGRKLLRRHHAVTVTEQITYTPLEGSPVTVTARFRLRA